MLGLPLAPEDDLGGLLDGLLGGGSAATAGAPPSTSVVVLLGITLLSVAPALLLMMTSFTKIFVVLAMTRNAIGPRRFRRTRCSRG